MILVAGGTGRLGTLLVQELRREGSPVRVLTRSAEAAERLRGQGVDAVAGDLRDPESIARAVSGCAAVVSAATGFSPGGAGTRKVDAEGNRALIAAAERAGVGRFVLVSGHGAAADASMPLFRDKFAAEEALRASSMAWTIVRPTAYLETWLEATGMPLAKKGATQIFGSARAPMNFVSVRDVASLVLRALHEDALTGRVIDIGGPNLTLEQLSTALHAAAGTSGKVNRVPLPALRVMAVAARPFSPFLARVAQASVVTSTQDMRFDPAPDRATVPGLPFTTLDEVMRDVTGSTAVSAPGAGD
jgi:uncharacterized protein YbjT (DUF2867 family)